MKFKSTISNFQILTEVVLFQNKNTKFQIINLSITYSGRCRKYDLLEI